MQKQVQNVISCQKTGLNSGFVMANSINTHKRLKNQIPHTQHELLTLNK